MIYLVAGTRPNFMKIAPIRREIDARRLPVRMIHTGQHFDASMSDVFFRDLGLPAPDLSLQAGGGSHAKLTASVLVGVEADLLEHRPGVVVVVGDVTSTLGAALAAAKLGIPVAHVEAGLRSRDWTMPEEINRVLTDRLSDLLLIPSVDAKPNLAAEGIAEDRVVFIGNVMIDSLRHALTRRTDVLERLRLAPGDYAVVTLHRPVNVDERDALDATLRVLEAIASRVTTVFPIHPRTVANLAAHGMQKRLENMRGLLAIEPLGYNDFVTLFASAKLVATDSGGIQEETTALGIPCLTLRETTERPITVSEGTNVVVGMDGEKISRELDTIMAGRARKGKIPEGWDGHAAMRAVDAIERFLRGSPPSRVARSSH
jgi:UDP-N-acetylglucosamine 2-epimerase (non-hydrolysing)